MQSTVDPARARLKSRVSSRLRRLAFALGWFVLNALVFPIIMLSRLAESRLWLPGDGQKKDAPRPLEASEEKGR